MHFSQQLPHGFAVACLDLSSYYVTVEPVLGLEHFEDFEDPLVLRCTSFFATSGFSYWLPFKSFHNFGEQMTRAERLNCLTVQVGWWLDTNAAQPVKGIVSLHWIVA